MDQVCDDVEGIGEKQDPGRKQSPGSSAPLPGALSAEKDRQKQGDPGQQQVPKEAQKTRATRVIHADGQHDRAYQGRESQGAEEMTSSPGADDARAVTGSGHAVWTTQASAGSEFLPPFARCLPRARAGR